MKRLFDILGSVRLTLGVLLGLALVSVAGTIRPIQPGRFEIFYQTPWFRLLLALLVVNLAVCTWRSFGRLLGERRRLLALLAEPGVTGAQRVASTATADGLADRLANEGYSLVTDNGRLLARRGLAGRWAGPILHLSILVVILAAWAGELGFVGTLNIYVTHQSDTYFDWDVEAERPLGFTFRLDHFEPVYYPIELKFATYEPLTRKPLQEFTTREGETVAIGPDLAVQVQRFYPEEEHLVLGILRNGALLGEYHALSGKRTYPNSIDPGVVIKPTAFRDPVLKQLHSEVSILEKGRVVRQGVIEVNTPLKHRGVAIYQTAYNRDESGFWVCGFQFSRDPGEPFVWGGSIVMSLALLIILMVRYQAIGFVPGETGWQVLPLAGFRSGAGRERLNHLSRVLSDE